MIYAIQILHKAINEHRERIFELEHASPEMVSEMIFIDEEIKEREGYILILESAIKKLNDGL